jgi:hypothetical protein
MYFLQIDKFIHLDWGNWKHYRSKSKYSSLQVGTIVMKLVFCHGSYFFILFVFKLMPVEGSCWAFILHAFQEMRLNLTNWRISKASLNGVS